MVDLPARLVIPQWAVAAAAEATTELRVLQVAPVAAVVRDSQLQLPSRAALLPLGRAMLAVLAKASQMTRSVAVAVVALAEPVA